MAQIRKQLYTVGYAGHTLETFIQTLHARHISILLDIRMTPISRKKGFSKRALYQTLEAAGITYRHLPALGSPKDLRRHLSVDGDYEAFFRAFRVHLSSQEESLQQAAQLASTHLVCLMCVEKCPEECHRSIVADAIAQVLGKNTSVQHLPTPNPQIIKAVKTTTSAG